MVFPLRCRDELQFVSPFISNPPSLRYPFVSFHEADTHYVFTVLSFLSVRKIFFASVYLCNYVHI